MFFFKRQKSLQRDRQRGNVLWFILIAIFLLGGLTVMLTRTSTQTDDTGESDKAMVRAANIIRTASFIETAYQNLIMNGCSENTISFWQDENLDGVENATDTRYNPSAPTDRSCHIFDVKGGAAKSITVGDSINVAQVVNMGTTARDLYYVVQNDYDGAPRGISTEVCRAINKIAGNNFNMNSLPQADMTTGPFTGSFASGQTLGDNGLEVPMAGVKTGCNIDNQCGTGTCNSFYSVIVVR